MKFRVKRKILNLKKTMINFIQILLGTALMAIGTSQFLLPNQLSSGGFAGIATITYYLLKIPMGTVMFALNIPLFIIAFIKLR